MTRFDTAEVIAACLIVLALLLSGLLLALQ
jgi:hypothetical protein